MTPTKATVHEQFNTANADVTIRSSDNVLFKLHRANLSVNTGAFPGTEMNTQGEEVQLTESAEILELVFQFIYPRRHPTLQNLDFSKLLDVSEAVEKYEVFPALHTCEMRLQEHIQEHAHEILVHAIKHDYPSLMNRASVILALSPLVPMLEQLPTDCIIPWVKYKESWKNLVFTKTKQFITDMSMDMLCRSAQYSRSRTTTICERCRRCLRVWLSDLETHQTQEELQAAIKDHNIDASATGGPGGPAMQHCTTCTGNTCIHLLDVKVVLQDSIKNVPLFSTFLSNTVSSSSSSPS
ncbi:hypothetical protein CPC08DRAFT_704343 [Agrocybe pediades]|nr:hypothetical protein CPC08DRAFT_704343 [Agrocybe pediades]